jgi:hypothetical protein
VSAGITIWDFFAQHHHFGNPWYLTVLLALSFAWLAQRHWALRKRHNQLESDGSQDSKLPALIVSPVVGGSMGHLAEAPIPGSLGVIPGDIYLKMKIFVAARSENEYPITILRIKAKIQFEDEEVKEYETGQIEWFDETVIDDALGEGRPMARPGSVLQLTFFYVAKAKIATPGVDEPGKNFHVPTKSKVVTLVVIDSLNRAFAIGEPFDLPIFRLEEPTPFIPG